MTRLPQRSTLVPFPTLLRSTTTQVVYAWLAIVNHHTGGLEINIGNDTTPLFVNHHTGGLEIV